MSKRYLPFFPLKLAAFPGEQLNLHVFEPRYKQLINECIDENRTFGIPVFGENMQQYGSEMEVIEVVKRYPDGEMDITTRCLNALKIHSFDEKAPGKLYAAGEVESIENILDATPEQWQELKRLGKELISILKMDDTLDVDLLTNSFELAHKLGLTLEQEYDMLQMARESKRQSYMISHLQRAIPLIREMESAKDRIKMNGHFQHHDPLNF